MGRLGADGGGVAVPGVHPGLLGQGEEPFADGFHDRGKSENDRPVAPGPPLNNVSPENRTPASGTYRHTDPGECPGVWMTRISIPATGIR
jgi:hypothetical protein